MIVNMTIGSKSVDITMDDNAATRDFIAQLPLTLTLTDFHATEKISDLAAPLSEQGAPAGFKPSAGDVTFYAPWGNLAIFYRDFDYSPGLIKLGKLTSGVDQLADADGDVEAVFTAK